MSAKSKPHLEQVEQVSALDALGRRQNLVRILFIHRSLADVEHCLHELKRARFTVSSDVVVTPEQFGAAECIEMDSIGHLPVAIHRALDEKALRDQRDRAEKDLRRSEARYRALAGNLS